MNEKNLKLEDDTINEEQLLISEDVFQEDENIDLNDNSEPKKELVIGHLFPDLLNLYGDSGNIICLMQRSKWRGIEPKLITYKIQDEIDFDHTDILFIGGGSDREQSIVCDKLKSIRESLEKYVERGGVILAICGGYQLLGESYRAANNDIVEGVGILDIKTENGEGRLIGNMIIKSEVCDMPIVGFENHGGRTFIGDCEPLGRVVVGNGNNGQDKTEGIHFKNVYGTYLHGPLLPKNPHLCDRLILEALKNKYRDIELCKLDDSEEIAANQYICDRFISQ